MNVYLLDQNKKTLAEFKSGVCGAGSKEWTKVEHNFLNYPSGVRCIKFEDGSKDKKFWAGHYGAKMCQPTVKIHLGTFLSIIFLIKILFIVYNDNTNRSLVKALINYTTRCIFNFLYL